jgi:hypothetical protein
MSNKLSDKMTPSSTAGRCLVGFADLEQLAQVIHPGSPLVAVDPYSNNYGVLTAWLLLV